MKLNLNENLKDLEGKEIDNMNIGKVIANVLASANSGDALKFISWAKKLYNGEELDLDPSDLITFKDFVNNSQHLSLLLKAQVFEKYI